MNSKRSVSTFLLGLGFFMLILVMISQLPSFITELASRYGLADENALNLGMMLTATIALIITSNAFYRLVLDKMNVYLDTNKSLSKRNILNALVIGLEFVMAIPKRSLLFGIYLGLVVLEQLGAIDKANDYILVAVFVIGVDRVGKILPQEIKQMKEFINKAMERL